MEVGCSPAALCLWLRAGGGVNTVWGAIQSGDTRGRDRGSEGVCCCVCEKEREKVTSPVPVWGSNLRLEPVVAIQMHKGWFGCFWFSRKHALAGVWAVVACFHCHLTDFNFGLWKNSLCKVLWIWGSVKVRAFFKQLLRNFPFNVFKFYNI